MFNGCPYFNFWILMFECLEKFLQIVENEPHLFMNVQSDTIIILLPSITCEYSSPCWSFETSFKHYFTVSFFCTTSIIIHFLSTTFFFLPEILFQVLGVLSLMVLQELKDGLQFGYLKSIFSAWLYSSNLRFLTSPSKSHGIIHGRFPLKFFCPPIQDMSPNIILRKNCPAKFNADFV